jgi:monofunctional biosynthetic peptidoglycan transglycosylase
MIGVAQRKNKKNRIRRSEERVLAFAMRSAWRLMRSLGIAAAFVVAASVLTIVALRWLRPPTTAFMMQAKIEAYREGRTDFRLQQQWVYWDAISPYAGIAVVAAEDQHFPSHHGFDLDAIGDALRTRAEEGRLRGASTISQQVVKNIFLWSGRSVMRKATEAYLTVLLETLVPKRRILEIYLNVAEFGDGIYGVEAASREFFRKPSSELRPVDAALLAAVLPNPKRLRVAEPSVYVRERQRWIVAQMKQLGGPLYLDRL